MRLVDDDNAAVQFDAQRLASGGVQQRLVGQHHAVGAGDGPPAAVVGARAETASLEFKTDVNFRTERMKQWARWGRAGSGGLKFELLQLSGMHPCEQQQRSEGRRGMLQLC